MYSAPGQTDSQGRTGAATTKHRPYLAYGIRTIAEARFMLDIFIDLVGSIMIDKLAERVVVTGGIPILNLSGW
jgi:hypothetical protein